MKKFEDFVEGLNNNIEIPDTVDKRFEETLNQLEVSKRKRSSQWVKVASIVAVFVLTGGIVLASNPAMASNIPILGNIFQMVENKIIYSGDYSNKQTLSEEEMSNDILTAEDKDIKITASEVYSDGFSVFVTMKMDSAKYDFSKIKSLEETGGKSITMAVSYGINSDVGKFDYDFGFDGDNVGNHVFIGMVKFNKKDYSLENGYINIEIKNIYIDEAYEPDNGTKSIEGSWKLKVPYETDKESGKEIVVNQKTDADLTVQKLFLSQYQLAVLSDVAYTMPYKNMSDEQIRDELRKKGGYLFVEALEEIRNTKNYDFYEMAVFDQDGNALNYVENIGQGDLQCECYSLRGKDISKLHIYITQNEEDALELMTAKTEKRAKEISEYDFVVDVK